MNQRIKENHDLINTLLKRVSFRHKYGNISPSEIVTINITGEELNALRWVATLLEDKNVKFQVTPRNT